MNERRRQFSYQQEKLMLAILGLMVPHEVSEEEAFAFVFFDCWKCLREFDPMRIDDEDARRSYDIIMRTLKRKDVDADLETGQYLAIARAMTFQERKEFSEAVFSLYRWFVDPEA